VTIHIKEEEEKIQGGTLMKIAIISTDGTIDGMVDERFGKAKKIVLFDSESGTHEVIDSV